MLNMIPSKFLMLRMKKQTLIMRKQMLIIRNLMLRTESPILPMNSPMIMMMMLMPGRALILTSKTPTMMQLLILLQSILMTERMLIFT